jgi:hypothetical protein
MVNDPCAQTARLATIRSIAIERGLSRALRHFPEAVEAAGERALRPLAACPSGPLTEPAAVFSPAPGVPAR